MFPVQEIIKREEYIRILNIQYDEVYTNKKIIIKLFNYIPDL